MKFADLADGGRQLAPLLAPRLTGSTVLVAIGQGGLVTARAAGVAVRAAGAARVVLAVPVCPKEAEASLRPPYDEVVAVVRPLVRRSLRWHYESFA